MADSDDDIFEKEQIDDFSFISSDAMDDVAGGSDYSDDEDSSDEDLPLKKRKHKLDQKSSPAEKPKKTPAKRKIGDEQADEDSDSASSPQATSRARTSFQRPRFPQLSAPQELSVAERLEKGLETFQEQMKERGASLFSEKLIARAAEQHRPAVQSPPASAWDSPAQQQQPAGEQPRYRNYARVPRDRENRENRDGNRPPSSSSSSSFPSMHAGTGQQYPGLDSPRTMYLNNSAAAQQPNQYGSMGVIVSGEFRSPTPPPPVPGQGLVPGLRPPPRPSPLPSASSSVPSAAPLDPSLSAPPSSSFHPAVAAQAQRQHIEELVNQYVAPRAPAASGSVQLPSELAQAEKRRVHFKKQCSKVVVSRLGKYYKEKKIQSKDDFKHLSRKLTHKIMQKEEGRWDFTKRTVRKIVKYIDRFFGKRKEPYRHVAKRAEPQMPRELQEPPPF